MTVSPDSLVVVGSRRGRPRGREKHSTVTAYLPTELHDRLVRLAKQQDVSVSRVLRDLIHQTISLQKK